MENVEEYMDENPSKTNEWKRREYPRQVDDTYIFDAASGIYKPRTAQAKYEHQRHTHDHQCNSPVDVKVRRDWVSLAISLLTLFGLFGTIYYAGQQWLSMESAAVAAGKANGLAEKGINASIVTSHLDQRAWISAINVSGQPETLKPFEITVQLMNSGKTPAIDVYTRGVTDFRDSFPNVISRCAEAIRLKETRSMIPPNAPQFLPIPATKNGAALAEGWDKQKLPSKYLYVFGCVVYDDIFTDVNWERSHWMTFCGVTGTSSLKERTPLRFNACKIGNDTGDGPPPT